MKLTYLKRILAWMLLLVVLCGCQGPSAQQPPTEPPTQPPTDPPLIDPDFYGLVLRVESGVTVKLYDGYGSSAIRLYEDDMFCEDDWDYYLFDGLDGRYRVVTSAVDRYTIHQNLYVDTSSGYELLDVTPPLLATTGYEPKNTIYLHSQPVEEEAMYSDPSYWPELEDAFQTPYFTNEREGAHQATTQEELMAFLKERDLETSNMYLYTLGVTDRYRFEIPLVIFTNTDLSGAKTLEEAAQLVQANNKLTVHYQAQIHGDEPAGGEGALAMVNQLCGDLGDEVLDTINVYMLPRINVEGAKDFKRRNVAQHIDMNRDMLRLETYEIRMQHKALQLFDPEVVIDGHEHDFYVTGASGTMHDLMMSTGLSANNGAEFTQLSIDAADVAFDALKENGLRPTFYNSVLGGKNMNSTREYVSSMGIFYFLMESSGIFRGTGGMARRVAAQTIGATEFLRYVKDNVETFQQVVDNEKQRIIDCGKTYNDDDKFTIQTTTQVLSSYTLEHPIIDHGTGKVLRVEKLNPSTVNKTVNARIRPTAYVIPAGQDWNQKVLDLLDLHEIQYTFVPAGTKISLQQYTGTTSSADLSAEKTVTFEKGAYVICLNQVTGNVICALMEPDVKDIAEQKGTLAQQGKIKAVNGEFPIYRYIHDLNAQGMIDLAK